MKHSTSFSSCFQYINVFIPCIYSTYIFHCYLRICCCWCLCICCCCWCLLWLLMLIYLLLMILIVVVDACCWWWCLVLLMLLIYLLLMLVGVVAAYLFVVDDYYCCWDQRVFLCYWFSRLRNMLTQLLHNKSNVNCQKIENNK